MEIGRRRFLGSLSLVLAPGLLFHTNKANAFAWVAAAQLAITAVSMFTKSDSGMGAYLGAILQLSQENIRLTQIVLQEIGNVQRQLALMPNVIAEAFITDAEYKIREDLQKCLDSMQLVKDPANLTLADQARMEMIITTCEGLAAKRTVPYGKRGVAAVCAPVAAALDLQARKTLGRSSEIPKALNVLYLDWMDKILDFGSKESLVGVMADQSQKLNLIVEEQIQKLSEVSPAISNLVSSATAAGIGAQFSSPLECINFSDKITAYCKPLYTADPQAWQSCLDSPLVDSARLVALIENKVAPIDEVNKEITRPLLSVTFSEERDKPCDAPKLPPGVSISTKIDEQRTVIESATTKAFDAIDTQRAALSAVYQLYLETRNARQLLANRSKLEKI